MKVSTGVRAPYRIIPRVSGGREKAARLERHLNWQMTKPITDGDDLKFLLLLFWMQIDLQRRMQNFWLYGVEELS